MIYFCRPKRVLLASTRHPDGFSLLESKVCETAGIIIILGQYMPIYVNILSKLLQLEINYSKTGPSERSDF